VQAVTSFASPIGMEIQHNIQGVWNVPKTLSEIILQHAQVLTAQMRLAHT